MVITQNYLCSRRTYQSMSVLKIAGSGKRANNDTAWGSECARAWLSAANYLSGWWRQRPHSFCRRITDSCCRCAGWRQACLGRDQERAVYRKARGRYYKTSAWSACILDASAIIRFLRTDHRDRFKRAQNLFEQAESGNVRLILPDAVLAEVVFVLVSVYTAKRTGVANLPTPFSFSWGHWVSGKESVGRRVGSICHKRCGLPWCLSRRSSFNFRCSR